VGVEEEDWVLRFADSTKVAMVIKTNTERIVQKWRWLLTLMLRGGPTCFPHIKDITEFPG